MLAQASIALFMLATFWKLQKFRADHAIDSNLKPPTPAKLVDHLFAHPLIEWSRLPLFQDVSMRLIAERLLPADHEDVYVQDEFEQHTLSLALSSRSLV